MFSWAGRARPLTDRGAIVLCGGRSTRMGRAKALIFAFTEQGRLAFGLPLYRAYQLSAGPGYVYSSIFRVELT